MKRLIAVCILSSFIALTYFVGNLYIRNVIDESNTMLEKCNLEYENTNNSTTQAEKLEKYWSKNEGMLSVFAHHNLIDEVEKAISTLVIYAKTENKEYFYEYSNTVKTLLHLLYEDNSFSMHSIL